MSQAERSEQHQIGSNSLFEQTNSHSLSPEPDTRIDVLKQGVKEACQLLPQLKKEDLPHDKDLRGIDNGLYPMLIELARGLGYTVEDSDAITKEILRRGRKGLRKKFASGWVIMVKQGSPLQMSAILVHEIAHHFTPDVYNKQDQILSNTIAEGTAFIVCGHYGLDISPQVFPYIAGYNNGEFTSEMRNGIKVVSSRIIKSIRGKG